MIIVMPIKDSLTKTISDLLAPYQTSIENPSGFAEVPHDEILKAYEYWLQYLKLLVKEPFTTQITHGLQDDGVDLILTSLNTDKKIGFQVKSYNDLNREFRGKVMSQITYSRKHGLEKLFIILCADLRNNNQILKVRNMISQVSQMQDNYVSVIEPEKAYPVYECYTNKEHPLVYLARNRQIIDLISGLSESLSTEDCKVEVSVKFTDVRQDNVKNIPLFSGEIKFKPLDKKQQNSLPAKITKLQQLSEKVEFTKKDIDEVTIKYPDGRKEAVKPDQLIAIPGKRRIGPMNIYPINSDAALVENIILYEEHSDQYSTTWKTNGELGPWFFELVVLHKKRDNSQLNFRWSFSGRKGNYNDLLNCLKLLRTIKQNKKIILEINPSIKREIPIEANNMREITDEEITMVENIIYIQKRLSQQIPVTDKYTNPIWVQIKNFLENNKIEIAPQPQHLSGMKHVVLDLVAKLKKQPVLKKYEFMAAQITTNIGGIVLKLPPTKITMKNVVLDENVSELEQKISLLQTGENIEFTLKPTTNENIIYEII